MRQYSIQHRLFSLLACLALLAAAALTGCTTSNTVLRQNAAEAIEEHRTDDAGNYLARAVQQDASDWEAQYMLGKVRLEQKRYGEAETALNNAYALHQDWPEVPQILDAEAEAIYQQGHKSHLASFLQRFASERQTPHDYLRQARYLNLIGDADGAALALKKATALAGKVDVQPYIERAEYYQSVNDTEKAIRDLRRAYTIDPNNLKVRQKLMELGVVPGPTIRLDPTTED